MYFVLGASLPVISSGDGNIEFTVFPRCEGCTMNCPAADAVPVRALALPM